MVVLNALMKQPVSLSCWGQFDVGRLPVEILGEDLGVVPGPNGMEYVSRFEIGGDRRESRVSADRDLVAAEADGRLARRLAADLEMLEEMGVALESIDWSSSGDTEIDRAKWREAVRR